MALAQGPWI